MGEVEQEVPPTAAELKRRRDRAADHQAEMLVEGVSHEGIRMLLATLQGEADGLRRAFTETLLLEDAIDQRKIDEARGTIHGLERASRLIAAAQKRLDDKDKVDSDPEPEEEMKIW